MRILLDTCALSEIRHPQGSERVKNAVQAIDEQDLYLSVITIGEIVKGISLLDEGKRKQDLSVWVQTLERHYSERILTVDLETTHIWGELTSSAQKKGKVVSVSDGLIAATAMRHGLHVMTRNVKDFEATGVMILNSWEQ